MAFYQKTKVFVMYYLERILAGFIAVACAITTLLTEDKAFLIFMATLVAVWLVAALVMLFDRLSKTLRAVLCMGVAAVTIAALWRSEPTTTSVIIGITCAVVTSASYVACYWIAGVRDDSKASSND